MCGTVGSIIVLRGTIFNGRRYESCRTTWRGIIIPLQYSMFIGALVTGMIASLFIGFITSKSKTKPDAAIGISFTAFLATGVIIISLINSTTDLYHILFGNLLAIESIILDNNHYRYKCDYTHYYILQTFNDFYL